MARHYSNCDTGLHLMCAASARRFQRLHSRLQRPQPLPQCLDLGIRAGILCCDIARGELRACDSRRRFRACLLQQVNAAGSARHAETTCRAHRARITGTKPFFAAANSGIEITTGDHAATAAALATGATATAANRNRKGVHQICCRQLRVADAITQGDRATIATTAAIAAVAAGATILAITAIDITTTLAITASATNTANTALGINAQTTDALNAEFDDQIDAIATATTVTAIATRLARFAIGCRLWPVAAVGTSYTGAPTGVDAHTATDDRVLSLYHRLRDAGCKCDHGTILQLKVTHAQLRDINTMGLVFLHHQPLDMLSLRCRRRTHHNQSRHQRKGKPHGTHSFICHTRKTPEQH